MEVLRFSHKGARENNEDVILSEKISEKISIYLIADGMGGYGNGELAAKTVIDTFFNHIKENVGDSNNIEGLISAAINISNSKIHSQMNEIHSKHGATIAGVIIIDKTAYGFWVGDVRLYYLRKNKTIFQSEDHSLINELRKSNQILSPSEIQKYRHIVTKSIQGNDETIEPGMITVTDIQENDKILLTSDGVHDEISTSEIENILQDSNDKNDFISRIETECRSRSKDNYSMILIGV
jgi:protein phosphatase